MPARGSGFAPAPTAQDALQPPMPTADWFGMSELENLVAYQHPVCTIGDGREGSRLQQEIRRDEFDLDCGARFEAGRSAWCEGSTGLPDYRPAAPRCSDRDQLAFPD